MGGQVNGQVFGDTLEISGNAGPAFFEGSTERIGTIPFRFYSDRGLGASVTLSASVFAQVEGLGTLSGFAGAFVDPLFRIDPLYADLFEVTQSVIVPGSLGDTAEFNNLDPVASVAEPDTLTLGVMGLLMLLVVTFSRQPSRSDAPV